MLRSDFLKILSLATLLGLGLTGCNSGWLGSSEPPPLPGERIPVLVFDQQLTADPALSAVPLQLPPPIMNPLWPNAGGNPAHGGGSYTLPPTLHTAWHTDIGAGLSDRSPLLASPISGDGVLYTLDSEGRASAVSAKDGSRLWQVALAPRRLEDKASGGGIALSGDRLYATLGYGEAVALNAADGSEIWRSPLPSPLRSAPTVSGHQLYVVGIDNQLGALSTEDGHTLWVHSGMAESAGLLGAPAPAVSGDVVLVAYSSGELYALRTQNGGELWSDNLAGTRREGGVMSIAAIRGMPVLAAGGAAALAISNSGRMVAIDTRSGQRGWEQRLSGHQMPWVAGDTVFVVSSQAQLMAINLRDGKLRWVTQLALWEHEDDKEGLISWYGPVLAGGKLWLTSSSEQLVSFNPATGAVLDRHELDAPCSRAPVVAGETLYTLDDEARLTAWR